VIGKSEAVLRPASESDSESSSVSSPRRPSSFNKIYDLSFTRKVSTDMFKTAATKIAHNSTIPALAGNKDLRPLQDLISAEKTVIISSVFTIVGFRTSSHMTCISRLQRLSVDYAKASEALRIWGSGEGDDLGVRVFLSSHLVHCN
jgi:hypothetical protein